MAHCQAAFSLFALETDRHRQPVTLRDALNVGGNIVGGRRGAIYPRLSVCAPAL